MSGGATSGPGSAGSGSIGSGSTGLAAAGRRHTGIAVVVLAAVALLFLPAARIPAFYESFLYLLFYWVALATSWNILSGYAHYLSFGHGAFFGAGVYTTATLTTKLDMAFLWTVPAAAAVAALLAAGIGAVVFSLNRLRGELFALLTLAVAFVLATIVLNTAIDGGPGVYLSAVPLPKFGLGPTSTIYVMGLVIAIVAVAASYAVSRSRLGLGLFAIHDDEDVAEAKGVPTFRYKMIAFAISAGIAGAVGAVHAIYVGYVTVGGTFDINVAVYVVLMSVLGGMRHWLGPAIGAVIIGASLYAFTSGDQVVIGRALVAVGLILVIVLLPEGVVPTVLARWRQVLRLPPPKGREVAAAPPRALPDEAPVSAATPSRPPVLVCEGVQKSFGGIHALRGASFELQAGEILGLVGPNGSGKTTLINVITGQYRRDAGSIRLAGHEIGGLAPHAITALGIARTYQIPRPFAHMSALDNVVLAGSFGRLRGDPATLRREAQYWLEFAGLGAQAQRLPAALNLHERKFLELARALAARPRILMLDEVLAGLTPTEIETAITLVRRIRDTGTAILFVEHNMRAVLELSDRLFVLNYGEVIAAGDPQEVVRQPDVIAAYLGSAHA